MSNTVKGDILYDSRHTDVGKFADSLLS